MPLIKSAKKQLIKNRKTRARNYPLRNQLKTTCKKAMALVTSGKIDEAKKFLPYAYKIIDTAAKKHFIHVRNAANKKSRIAQAINKAEKAGVGAVASKSAEVKTEAAAA